MKAAVNLGTDCVENLRSSKNKNFDEVKPLFNHAENDLQSRTGIQMEYQRLTGFYGGRIGECPPSVVSWQDRIEWLYTISPVS